MSNRTFIVGLGVAALLAGTAAPAMAQVGDFFCSTFSIACDPPPPPPPAPAPVVEEAPAPKKARHKAKKKVVKAKAESAAAATQ